MNTRRDASEYKEAIEIVRRAQAGNVSVDYELACILGPRYPLGHPSLTAIWAAQDLLKTDPDRAATLLERQAIG